MMAAPHIGTAEVIRANSRHLPVADDSVDLVVTSPPYFALRSYQDGGEHYAGQIGSEPTPDEFVSSLLEVTAECVRVLKPSGSLWVNLGDKYAGSAGHAPSAAAAASSTLGGAKQQWTPPGSSDVATRRGPAPRANPKRTGIANKSLMGIPWRYALRSIDDLGLILRAEVIWSKPNGLPESVTDRVRRSHEQWFHFTLEPRYFSAVDEIREANDPKNLAHSIRYNEAAKSYGKTNDDRGDKGADLFIGNPLGKLPGSVWTIPTEPLRVPDHLGIDHFAAFPTEWPKRIIQGWSPAGVCVECEEGRRPVSEAQRPPLDLAWRERQGNERDGTNGLGGSSLGTPAHLRERVVTGYVCACPEPTADTRPAVVLDPFGGTGTTALVAKALGRHGISVDMSADYCRLAQWRTNDRNQLAKILGVAKADAIHDDEQSLLDLIDGGAA